MSNVETPNEDEIPIDYTCIAELKSEQKNIWRLFFVNIIYGNVYIFQDDPKKVVQWITIIGKIENRERAKAYIKAICNPEYIIEVEMSKEKFDNCDTIDLNDDIIKNYQVVISTNGTKLSSVKSLKIILKGSELNVAIVKSILDDKINEYSNVETDIYDKIFNSMSRQTSLEPCLAKNESEQLIIDSLTCREINEDYGNNYKNIKRRASYLVFNKQISKVNGEEIQQNNDLRVIVIDGSDVALHHGKNKGGTFSCKGIKLVVDYFLKRGHQVEAYLPRFRRGNADRQCPTVNPEYLNELDVAGILKYYPSNSCDDRFIVDTAIHHDGVIVSNKQYENILLENPDCKIRLRLLEYVFTEDIFIPVVDPSGRKKPTLNELLLKSEYLAKS